MVLCISEKLFSVLYVKVNVKAFFSHFLLYIFVDYIIAKLNTYLSREGFLRK